MKQTLMLLYGYKMEDFNGQCYFPDKYWVANDVLQLFTESSGNPNLGCGAYFAEYWVQLQWPNHYGALPMIKIYGSS